MINRSIVIAGMIGGLVSLAGYQVVSNTSPPAAAQPRRFVRLQPRAFSLSRAEMQASVSPGTPSMSRRVSVRPIVPRPAIAMRMSVISTP